MSDYGEKITDKKLDEVNRRIQSVYKEAEKDIQKKMDEFTRKFKEDEERYLKLLNEGKVTQKDFDTWKQEQIFHGKIWQSKKDQISEMLRNSNDVALKIINGETNGIFAANANYAAYALEHGAGVNFGFGLYDNATVSRLIKDDPKLLPEWKIHEKKDYIWNQKKLNNCITQGIIQGESLDKITKRVAEGLSGQNLNKMKTFAITAMAGAQNAGRDTRYKEAEKLGINLVEEWIATLDRRTRDSHRDMDGEQKKPGKTFSNGCRFPGDPFAPAHEVYNCRCALTADLLDYPDEEYERYDNESRKSIKAMSYREWEKYKMKG